MTSLPRSTFLAPFKSKWFYLRLCGLYFGAIAVLYCAQGSLIYHPVRLTPAQFKLHVAVKAGPSAKVLEDFDAVVMEPARGARAGTAMLFHGNGGLGLDRAGLAQDFLTRGYRLVLAEYPGYGARPGTPSETSLVADGLALYDKVRTLYPAQPVILVGESMGSGVAVQVATHARIQPERLVLITPFLSLAATAARQIPFMPVRWLIRDTFDSATRIKQYTGPVGVLVADKDALVTAAAGEALCMLAATRGSATLARALNAGHNDWFDRTSAMSWTALLGQVVETVFD